jgi:hypothetical protein
MSGAGAVDGLVERLAPAGRRVGGAQRGRGQHPEAAGEHRGAVGEQIAEQVVGDDDIELLGPPHELHSAVVGVHVAELDVHVLAVVKFLHDLAPQDAGVHHVRLLDRGHRVAPDARQLEPDPGHALDLGRGVDLGVDRPPLAVP